MKKVLLFLVVAGLAVGLAQAQTPQVRKLWQIQPVGNEEVVGCSVDTANGGRDPWVIALVGGKLRAFDRQGGERVAISVPQPGKVWWSRDIKFFGTFPNGELRDRSGNGIGSTPPYPGYVEIADDGNAFVIRGWPRVPTPRRPPDSTQTWSDVASRTFSNDTLMFFDKSGHMKRLIPAPYDGLFGQHYAYPKNRFSKDGSRFVVLLGNGSTLCSYDRVGNLIWRDSLQTGCWTYAISKDGSVFAVFSKRKAPGYRGMHGNTLWGRFYDKNGRVESEVQLGIVDTLRYRSWSNQSDISADGNHALFNAGGFMVKVTKNPPKVDWRIEAKEDYHASFGNGLFTFNGDYVVAQLGVENKGKEVVVLDSQGRIIFEDLNAPYWNIRTSGGGNFFVSYGSNAVALYEIVTQ